MTDSADYLISRIVETGMSVEWNGIGWRSGLAVIAAGTVLFLAGMLLQRKHGHEYRDMDCGVMILGIGAAIFGAMMALICYVGMLQDRDVLSGLVASYEALYGPLPEGIL